MNEVMVLVIDLIYDHNKMLLERLIFSLFSFQQEAARMEKKTKAWSEGTIIGDTTEEAVLFGNVGMRTRFLKCSPQAEPFSEELAFRLKTDFHPIFRRMNPSPSLSHMYWCNF